MADTNNLRDVVAKDVEETSNYKPCFIMNEEELFIKLHMKADEEARKKLNQYSKFHPVLINTGLSLDGKSVKEMDKDNISKNLTKKDFKWKFWNSSKKEYEVGLILDFENLKFPSKNEVTKQNGDFFKALNEVNKETFEQIAEIAYSVLDIYCYLFSGIHLKKENLRPFLLGDAYSEGEIQLKDYVLGVDIEKGFKIDKFDKNNTNDEARVKAIEEIRKKIKRFGYKFGYTLNIGK